MLLFGVLGVVFPAHHNIYQTWSQLQTLRIGLGRPCQKWSQLPVMLKGFGLKAEWEVIVGGLVVFVHQDQRRIESQEIGDVFMVPVGSVIEGEHPAAIGQLLASGFPLGHIT